MWGWGLGGGIWGLEGEGQVLPGTRSPECWGHYLPSGGGETTSFPGRRSSVGQNLGVVRLSPAAGRPWPEGWAGICTARLGGTDLPWSLSLPLLSCG